MTCPRILLSGRDVGAGLSIAEVARLAQASGDLQSVFVAQEPLLSVVRPSLPDVIACNLPAVDTSMDDQAEALRDAARSLLRAHRPDALLVGLSGPGAGIDEVLLDEAQPLPRYAFQDYWGDVNKAFDAIADCFFVLDDQAARLTRDRCGQRCVVVGSPKHADYGSLDVAALRSGWRTSQGLAQDDHAIIFFGQPFWNIEGYADTLERLGMEVRTSLARSRLFYRPHPKESARDAVRIVQRFKEMGLEAHLETGVHLEAALAGGDLVVSCFSTAGYDMLMLNRCSPRPLAATLYLMYDERLRAWYEDKSGLRGHPLSDQGLALLCSSPEDLSSLLLKALSPGTRQRFWRTAVTTLPDPTDAAGRVIETVLRDLDRATTKHAVRANPLAR